MQDLAARIKFIERHPRRVPWLRHKWLLLQLWTGAYMLDDWEKASLLLFAPLAICSVFALWWYSGGSA